MKKGFIIGKFMPLHKGHIALIDFAQKNCDLLYVILCYSSDEPINGAIREKWLQQELQSNKNIRLISFPYNEMMLPNTSQSSRAVSKVWADELKKIVPGVNIIFSSEPYGSYLAEYMDIEHISFDEMRVNIPVSASMIRKEPFRYWHYLVESAKPYYVKKIALLGSESTGKSTLTEKLSLHFKTRFVSEVAREIVQETNKCTFNHLKEIALQHAKKINETITSANKLLFLDTDINITKSYSNFLFKQELIVDDKIEKSNKADLYFFLETDCPFIQDGTRLNKEDREKLSISHKRQLRKSNINYISVKGDWEERYLFMIDMIERKFNVDTY